MANDLGRLTEEEMEKLARFFWVFSDPTRLRIIVQLLSTQQDSCCVNKIAETLGLNQPAVSQHLRVLKNARLVKVVRDRQFYRYSISDEHVKDLLLVGMNHIFENRGEFK